MLRFETCYEDADWLMGVLRDNNSYDRLVGTISRSLMGGKYLFAPEECVCLSSEEMGLITDKMKELENARTKIA
jgi:hypothetical protein